MKIKYIIWLLILVFVQQSYAQDSTQRYNQALNLLEDYQAASHFKSMGNGHSDPAWESLFKDCFDSINIIFDIPSYAVKKNSRDASSNNKALRPEFLNYVMMDKYIELVRDIFYNHPGISEIQYEFIILGEDKSDLDSNNRIIFEIEKRFARTPWSAPDSRKYLYEITFVDGNPKISSIKVSETDFSRNNVTLTLEQPIRKGKKKDDFSREVITEIRIDFDENVFDRSIIERTDSTGLLRLGMVANRARVIIDKVMGSNKERFTIPSEWKTQGMRVNDQPGGGFIVPIKPYKWSGWTFSLWGEGGPAIQSANNTQNFSTDTDFKNITGHSFGGGITFTRFANPDFWRAKTNNWIYGLGAGASFHYARYRVDANTIKQNEYFSIDQAGDTSYILISGSKFEETMGTAIIKVPIFAEVRKKVRNRFLGFKSFSLQAGVNMMVPFLSRYNYEGSFSRHGQYPEYNNQIITDDPFYNYYSNKEVDDSGVIDYHNFMFEGVIRFNGYIPLSDSKPDNSIIIGFLFTTPFSRSTSRNTSEYLMNSGEDEYTSIAYSKEKLYDYFFGISVGINFITYRPQ